MSHRLLLTPSSNATGAPVFHTMTDTMSYSGPSEYENGSLSRVNFPGGYVSGGVAYHYIHDHQGNVCQVVNATTGKVDQENHYYPVGCCTERALRRISRSGAQFLHVTGFSF